MQHTISVNRTKRNRLCTTINSPGGPLHAPSRRGATSSAWKPTHYAPRPQPTTLSNASDPPGIHREDPTPLRVTRDSSYQRSQAINSTASPAAAPAPPGVCRAYAACGPWLAVAMISRSLALVVRTAEHVAASTSRRSARPPGHRRSNTSRTARSYSVVLRQARSSRTGGPAHRPPYRSRPPHQTQPR
jgi:hypothetical protein